MANRKKIKDVDLQTDVKGDPMAMLAIMLVANCVRNNTILEDIHSSGRITNKEMKNLMGQIVDNVYSCLNFIFYGHTFKMTVSSLLAGMYVYTSKDWHYPKLDVDLLKSISSFGLMASFRDRDPAKDGVSDDPIVETEVGVLATKLFVALETKILDKLTQG